MASLEIYGESRCSVCSKPIPVAAENLICPLCLSNKRYFAKGFSLFNYNKENIKKIIEFIKFYKKPAVADFLFYFKKQITLLDIFKNCDAVVPVPMHRKDIQKRGFNQTVYIAKAVSKITGIPIRYDVLEKIKQTKKQLGLNHKEREKNLSGAFKIGRSNGINSVVLIDDVFTTGSTINECAKTLKKANIESYFFTIATTPSVPDH